MISFPHHAVLKTVPLKFAGTDLRFQTSHALFSSHHVDDGTLLLLKTLAQQKVVPATGRVLDAGCGYGPLAVALKKHRPALEVVARDRLALAAQFTAENARINGVEVDARPGLLLEGTPGPWDLIVSNLPAKAGAPVLADFARRAAAALTPTGRVAVVIVETLADEFAQTLDRWAIPRLYDEPGRGYRVFHFGPKTEASAPDAGPAFPGVYLRGRSRWSLDGRDYEQDTVWGLPNFDTLDYRTLETLPLLAGRRWPVGEALVWNPVQGHLAAWVAAQSRGTLHLAGPDVLALRASARAVGARAEEHPVAFLPDLDLGPGSLASALVQLDPEPEIPWAPACAQALARFLAPGAPLVLNGSSTDVHRWLEHRQGFRLVDDRRARGWRAVVLERLGSSSLDIS